MSALTPHDRVTYLAWASDVREHERVTERAIAKRLAALLDCRFDGECDGTGPPRPVGYAVPDDTLVSIDAAARWGIRGAADLFGGVVPFPFVATKAITHGLVGDAASAPAGWSAEFAKRVEDVALPGRSAFSIADARHAGVGLLRAGPVRVKPALAAGGAGQTVARDRQSLDRSLAALDVGDVERAGVVLEADLSDVRTLSVGQVLVGPWVASYFGTQRTTPDRHGRPLYGGSSLTVTRGGFDALERLAGADADLRDAVARARAYHAAALGCFAGMFASRCNYDIVRGRDARGRLRAGVLEQSWRIGGASGAEIAALEAFRDDPALEVVRTSSVEVHGTPPEVPADATLYFRGTDPAIGPVTKYARVDGHGHA